MFRSGKKKAIYKHSVLFLSSLPQIYCFPYYNKNSCNCFGEFQCETAKIYCSSKIFVRHISLEDKKIITFLDDLKKFFSFVTSRAILIAWHISPKNNKITLQNSNCSIVVSIFCCYKLKTFRSFYALVVIVACWFLSLCHYMQNVCGFFGTR